MVAKNVSIVMLVEIARRSTTMLKPRNRNGRRARRVRYYRLVIMTQEGHVRERNDVKCADDADAKERAGMFFTTYAVELWDGLRRVASFPAKIER